MSTIFALAGLDPANYKYARNADQSLLYTATEQFASRISEDLAMRSAVFVEEETWKYSERYVLPGGGYMNERAEGTRGNLVRAGGEWDVAYPLRDYSEEIGATDIDIAYMTPAEYQRHVDTVTNRHVNRTRLEILKALLLSSNLTFTDKMHGSLTVRRLANADGSIFPSKLGDDSGDLASHSHYFGTNYATASISNTNDPVPTLVEHLAEHFGDSNAMNVVVFTNTSVRDKISGLTAYKDIPDGYIRAGVNTDVPEGMPNVPGIIIGRHTSGAWLSFWRDMPQDYLLAIHLDAPAPLKRRVDPPETGLSGDLRPLYRVEDRPIESMAWRSRYGFGVGNRLSAVACQLVASTSYTAPTFAA